METILTTTDVKILEILVDGFNNDEIADRMNISKSTVKTHLESIYRNLNVKNRTHAAAFVIRNGYVL